MHALIDVLRGLETCWLIGDRGLGIDGTGIDAVRWPGRPPRAAPDTEASWTVQNRELSLVPEQPSVEHRIGTQ